MLQERTESEATVAVLSEWQLGVNEAYLVSYYHISWWLATDQHATDRVRSGVD